MENKKGKLRQPSGRRPKRFCSVATACRIVTGLLLGFVLLLAIINAEHAFGDGLVVILNSGAREPAQHWARCWPTPRR